MKIPFSLAFVSLVGVAGNLFAGEPASAIKLDSVGYLPAARKIASVAAKEGTFEVVRASDGAVVLSGRLAQPIRNSDTDETLAAADFSAVKEPGEYRLRVEGAGESAAFKIAADVFAQPFFLATRGMYLWRCGVAVDGDWNGRHFHHEACHTDDAWLDFTTGKHEKRASLGGWHDAGDYNKYVTNAGVTVGVMLRAWEEFGPAIQKIGLKIPESGGALPDYLAEIKFETDWLFTMQNDDGSVYHKVTTQYFGPFVLPEKETTPRYFVPSGSTANGNFVAMMAQAARAFKPYDAAYAERCLAAARKTYAFLLAHPEDALPDQSKVKTGRYDSKDADERLWAAAELWETTGEAAILRDLETRIAEMKPVFDEDFDWANVKDLGLLAYLFSKHTGRNEKLVSALSQNLLKVADTLVKNASAHGYQRPMGSRYYWGCNGGVARQTVLLQAAYRLKHDETYRATALDAIHHLFGRNYDARSYVTGLGFKPPAKPHDRRSGGDQVDEPWPGYLVGGGHPTGRDWHDVEPDARTNEIAINWNAALIYALAGFLE